MYGNIHWLIRKMYCGIVMSDFSLLMLYWLKQVWTPDIVLYNSAGDGEQGREMRTLIQVRTLCSLPLYGF
jgi:hypothetical protein